MTACKLNVLLVEDNGGDVYMFQEALEEAGLDWQLHVADSGNKAMDFLQRRGNFADAPRPDLVVVDLNMPPKTGKEVMAEMEQDEQLSDIPVAVLTSSQSESGIGRRFPGLISAFAVKTPIFKDLVHIIRDFDRFTRSDRVSR